MRNVDLFRGLLDSIVGALLDIAEHGEYTAFPLTSLGRAVLVGLDAFSNGFSLEPLAFIAATIGPRFYTVALRLAINPLSVVDLPIRKLALTLEELGLLPLAFKDSSVG